MNTFELFNSDIPKREKRLLLLAGPCQIESLEHCLMIAEKLQEATRDLPLEVVFKSSFDKANRTSIDGTRGIGLDEGLSVLLKVHEQSGLPTVTDIHSSEQAKPAAQAVQMLQIPAFLCRQTDLLIAAGKTKIPLNIKKGQFLHPKDMKYAAEKAKAGGATEIALCERGTCFGYRDLVVDPRSFPMMRELGYPVIFDGTHSVQSMGGAGGSSGGAREFIPALTRAAAAVGIDGLFLEVHEEPSRAPSDGTNMLPINELRSAMEAVCQIHELVAQMS
ncbi:MAG: 3-deoxy-8-phosphooctulonate synthase [Bdellovibrionales bacterium]|nr:3-deoxy-8-phosphooctulonate synthase [Bdellovibrionales bacterium]